MIFRVEPFAFVFPDAWEENRVFYEEGPDIYKLKAGYTFLTEEGSQKVFAYIQDLGQIEQYIRKGVDREKDIHEVFPWREKRNGRH